MNLGECSKIEKTAMNFNKLGTAMSLQILFEILIPNLVQSEVAFKVKL